MRKPTIQFWFEYASTYSYLSVMRVEDVAGTAGVAVDWRPFLLGPIFKAEGRAEGPFIPYPAKHDYMWRDLERRAEKLGIPFRKPSVFPPHSLRTARVGLVAAKQGWCPAFSRAVFKRHWTEDITIGSDENLRASLTDIGKDPAEIIDLAMSDENKAALRAQTERASEMGIFGAPSFVADGELFWGDDRLEEAIDWAQKSGDRSARYELIG